jgi:Rap1a immunity proteins
MQGVQIVVKYIDARPARLQENFNKLAAEALRQAWPCSN